MNTHKQTSLIQRLNGFTAQVYEPVLHVVFSAFWFFALSGFLLIVSGTPVPLRIDAASLTGVATLFFVLFFLRVVDEIKDLDYDRVHNPDRPLVSGSVSLKDLELFMLGSAVLTLVLNVAVLGWGLAIIVALDMVYGVFLIELEKKVPAVADGMFLNLFATYPVNMALSVYVFVFCQKVYGVPLSLSTLTALVVFIAAFLHHEIGRKTCWPHKVSADKRHYSSEIGGKASAVLAGAIALFSSVGVFVLSSPWKGSGPGFLTGILILSPLLPALFGVYRFLSSEHEDGPDAPMTVFAMVFLLLFYVSIIVHTLTVKGLGLSWGGGLMVLAGLGLWMTAAWWAKDISIPGSIYISSTEELIRGNDMLVTVTFKAPVEPERLYAAYEKMVQDHPSLQSRWVFDEKKKRYAWTRHEDETLRQLLAHEKAHILCYHSLENIYADYVPTNTRLPIRLSPVHETQAVFVVNHVFTNGLNLLKWMEIFLSICHDEPTSPMIRPNVLGFKQRMKNYLSVFAAVRYMAAFMKASGKTFPDDTVDLSYGRAPVKAGTGYAVKTYTLSETQTAAWVSQAAEKGTTVSEYLCAALAEALFKAAPDKNRICVSAPTDLLWCIPQSTMCVPGNHTGSLIFQLKRNGDLHAQVKEAFRHFSQRVPLGIAKIMALFFKNHAKMNKHFLSQAEKPFKDRGPFEFYTLAFSAVGVIKLPLIRKYVDSISGHTKNQTLFILVVTLNDRLSVEVCVSKDLYDVGEVFGVLDGVFH